MKSDSQAQALDSDGESDGENVSSRIQNISEKLDFCSFRRAELAEALSERLAVSPYRADQLFQWVYQKKCSKSEEMTNIAKSLRPAIEENFRFPEWGYSSRQISEDGTRKYLIPVSNGDLVETVMIKQAKRMTLCVSSQVGCALGCKFCRTGTMGLKRHLSCSEIMQQVLVVAKDAEEFGDMFSNIVFMGMGEPLHNYENVTRALDILTDDKGLAISPKRITLSSVGLVPAIKKFLERESGVNMAISLNATTNEIRDQVMPINRRFPLEILLDTLKQAPMKKRDRYTIEYVLLAGVNDSDEDIKRLPKLLKGIPSKINLIPYNNNAGLGFESPSEKRVYKWQKSLVSQGLITTVRWSKGRDIDAACGQLVTTSKQGSSSSKLKLAE